MAPAVANDNDDRLAKAAAMGRRMAEETDAEFRALARSRLANLERARVPFPGVPSEVVTAPSLLEAFGRGA